MTEIRSDFNVTIIIKLLDTNNMKSALQYNSNKLVGFRAISQIIVFVPDFICVYERHGPAHLIILSCTTDFYQKAKFT